MNKSLRKNSGVVLVVMAGVMGVLFILIASQSMKKSEQAFLTEHIKIERLEADLLMDYAKEEVLSLLLSGFHEGRHLSGPESFGARTVSPISCPTILPPGVTEGCFEFEDDQLALTAGGTASVKLECIGPCGMPSTGNFASIAKIQIRTSTGTSSLTRQLVVEISEEKILGSGISVGGAQTGPAPSAAGTVHSFGYIQNVNDVLNRIHIETRGCCAGMDESAYNACVVQKTQSYTCGGTPSVVQGQIVNNVSMRLMQPVPFTTAARISSSVIAGALKVFEDAAAIDQASPCTSCNFTENAFGWNDDTAKTMIAGPSQNVNWLPVAYDVMGCVQTDPWCYNVTWDEVCHSTCVSPSHYNDVTNEGRWRRADLANLSAVAETAASLPVNEVGIEIPAHLSYKRVCQGFVPPGRILSSSIQTYLNKTKNAAGSEAHIHNHNCSNSKTCTVKLEGSGSLTSVTVKDERAGLTPEQMTYTLADPNTELILYFDTPIRVLNSTIGNNKVTLAVNGSAVLEGNIIPGNLMSPAPSGQEEYATAAKNLLNAGQGRLAIVARDDINISPVDIPALDLTGTDLVFSTTDFAMDADPSDGVDIPAFSIHADLSAGDEIQTLHLDKTSKSFFIVGAVAANKIRLNPPLTSNATDTSCEAPGNPGIIVAHPAGGSGSAAGPVEISARILFEKSI